MKNMFSFLTFYKNILKKSDKKYEIAMDSNKYVIIAMTPLILFIVSMIAYTIVGGMTIIPILSFLATFVNFIILNYTKLRGHEIKLERQEEAERLAREEMAKEKFKEYMERIERLRRMEHEAEQKRIREQQRRNFEEQQRKWQEHQRQQYEHKDINMLNAINLLGLKNGFTREDVKKAYRNLSKVYHPDMGGTEENFKRLNRAYEYIMNRI